MGRPIHSQTARAMLIGTLTFTAALTIHAAPLADELPQPLDPPPHPPQFEQRAGGVLADSLGYHWQGTAPHLAPRPNIAPAVGWYGYGFPVQTNRWGWFGAERHYPRVVWHRGYYGDCCRWAYRRGY